MRHLLVDRTQTLGEEIANAASHGIGLLLAAASMLILLARPAGRGGSASIVGVGVFSAPMIVLYRVSTLYYALPRRPAA